MILGSFSDYLPFNDLVKIVIACLAAAVIAPAAVSVAVVGLDLRDHRQAAGRGIALVAVGIVVLVALSVIGLYALATD